jgi:hypothetical protein
MFGYIRKQPEPERDPKLVRVILLAIHDFDVPVVFRHYRVTDSSGEPQKYTHRYVLN